MVRFSCFNSHIHSPKSKKIVEPSVGAMNTSLQDPSQIRAPLASSEAMSLDSSRMNRQDNNETGGCTEDLMRSVFVEQGWTSDGTEGKLDFENYMRIHQKGHLKKSQSLGSALCHQGKVLIDEETDYEIDQESSSGSLRQIGLAGQDGTRDPARSLCYQQENGPRSESVQVSSELINNKSIFSVEDSQHFVQEDPEISETHLSGGGGNELGDHTPRGPPMIVKSSSMPNVGHSSRFFGGYPYDFVVRRSKSSEDLDVLCRRWKEGSFHEIEKMKIGEHERNHSAYKSKEANLDNILDDGCDSYNYSASAKDWIMPRTDEMTSDEPLRGDSYVQQANELQGKDFKIKRIEEWVFDLQHCSPLEETNELLNGVHPANSENGSTAIAKENKVIPGMETAKRYISSLGAAATTAQLSNHGLAVIPFLGAFVSLRVLNLSGNAIVRITAGSLPRGLHMLNLSKNKISTIEGLRELTRLRVLDLSYNRIFRIGHGLASCSSLKELYLAGNKISEVEGLHRLLKLTILDLRFNKISTAKCLGQLAANYNSLQAISLEGNPAQKNVGDDQLKKNLQSLLPHLVYFNRQPTKVSAMKDAADRSVRLGISAHQYDRGLRSDSKAVRKGSHGLGATRPTSSTHGRRNHVLSSPKPTRGRHAHLPPSGGTKGDNGHRQHHFDSRLLNLRSELSVRRSRSEGTLGAL